MRQWGILACLAVALASTPSELCLAPGDQALQQFVNFEVSNSYCLRELSPDSSYELRVSYPATQPTLFTLTLFEADPLAGHLPGRATHGRKLLDTEKLVFATDEQGRVLHPALSAATPAERVWLRVAASPLGVSHLGQRAGTQYNLALDPVYLGVIPGTARPIIGAAVLTVVVLIATAWWLARSPSSPIRAAAKGD